LSSGVSGIVLPHALGHFGRELPVAGVSSDPKLRLGAEERAGCSRT
jgi:hypothetical protein